MKTKSTQKIKLKGEIYTVVNPRLMENQSLIPVILKMVPLTFQVLSVLWKSKPHAIITAGPSLALPFFPLAKLFGIKTIFIESWVRVKHRSLSGKLIYPFSDIFFVQWESMKKQYPKAVFRGRLS